MSLWTAIKAFFVTPVAKLEWHAVKASSFADPADVRYFKQCKLKGGTDKQCFAKGDNGEGYFGADFDHDGDFDPAPCWRDDVAYVALPREVWEAKWGTKENASLKRVLVKYNGHTIEAQLGDTMPSLRNIKNGCGIDLNPGAAKKLGLTPPFIVPVSWAWGD